MEGSCTPSSTALSIVDDQSNLRPNVLECHICMEPPRNPVATSCGHVFCWPCMYQWLHNQPKPCPVCRNILRRDINIFPLYGVGDGVWPTNSRAAEATSDNVIPPRPHNPLLFSGASSMEGSSQESLTTSSILNAYERTSRRLVRELVDERVCVRNMEHRVNNLEERNSDLIREAVERNWQHFEERNRLVQEKNDLERRNFILVQEAKTSREREQQLFKRGNRMGQYIARLRQWLAQADSSPAAI